MGAAVAAFGVCCGGGEDECGLGRPGDDAAWLEAAEWVAGDAEDVQWVWNDVWAAIGNVGISPVGRSLFDRTLSPVAVALIRDVLLAKADLVE